MPVTCLISPTLLSSPPVVPGDISVILGNNINSPSYENLLNFWYEYNYGCTFLKASEVAAIPNGASIYKIQLQCDNSTNGLYLEEATYTYCANAPATYTELPQNCRINLTSVTDTAWNNDVSIQLVNNNVTITYQQVTADPNINRWVDYTFATPFTHKGGENLIICSNCTSGTYTSGSSTNPKWKGITLSGTQPRLYAYDDKISGPAFAPTQVFNINNTFRPNVKIFWN